MESLLPVLITFVTYARDTVFTGFLGKIGENLTDALLNKLPHAQTTRLLAAGKEIPLEQALIDLEPLLEDVEVKSLLEQMRSLMNSNSELSSRLTATKKAMHNHQINRDNSQGYQFNDKVDAQNIGGIHHHYHYPEAQT
jgi:hypothetical protein